MEDAKDSISDDDLRQLVELPAEPQACSAADSLALQVVMHALARRLLEARTRIRELEQDASDHAFERELAGGCDD